MKYIFRSALLIAFIMASCNGPKRQAPNAVAADSDRDLNEIKKDGKLRALIAYSATSYFLYRGEPMGYEYELLKRLADDLGVELELKVSKNLDELLPELKKGTVDIVAHALAITSGRKKEVSFADYLYITEQVLVQRKPENWRRMTLDDIQKQLITDPMQLIGDTVSVRMNSSYFTRIENLSKEIGGEIIIDTLDGNLTTDEIIKMVAEGTIKYSLADKNLATINASYYSNLDVEVPLSFSQRIAWAVNPNATKLLNATNKWLKKEKKQPDYNVIYDRYFTHKRSFKRRVNSPFYSLNQKKISKYDLIIKDNSAQIGWDWRLLASLIYQESQFDPEAESWTGARGLMQMMPAAAEEMGVKNKSDPKDIIKGGANYLKRMHDRFEAIPDAVQRIKFAMASYNCGYSHVVDAQKLAAVNGLDSTVWDEHVEKMIVALSYPQNFNHEVVKFGYVRGIEPFQYVDEIFKRYEHYREFID